MIIYSEFVFNGICSGESSPARLKSLVNRLYGEKVARLDFNRLRCGACQRAGDYEIKGYYRRKISINGVMVPVTVLRMKCRGCGRTHAIMFLDFVPYYRLASSTCHNLMARSFRSILYDDQVLYRLKRRASAFFLSVMHLAVTAADAIASVNLLSIPSAGLSFLQIHRGRTELFRRFPTT